LRVVAKLAGALSEKSISALPTIYLYFTVKKISHPRATKFKTARA
jgi:hypothetical protein